MVNWGGCGKNEREPVPLKAPLRSQSGTSGSSSLRWWDSPLPFVFQNDATPQDGATATRCRGFFVYGRGMESHDLLNVTGDEAMLGNDEESGGAVFVLSNRPLVPLEAREQSSLRSAWDYENLGELPRFYGRPVLFGIARDPHTLFAYWEIDWKSTFGDNPPADRKVHLRVLADDGTEESKMTVEPFAGNHCVAVAHARSTYRIELGYHGSAEVWNSVATSEAIATPPDDVSEDDAIDVATIPFHLSFQRMVDAFRASKYDGDALVEIVGRLQERADDPTEIELTETDRELMRAIDWGLSEADSRQRSRLRKSADPFAARQRIEAILGFGVWSLNSLGLPNPQLRAAQKRI